MAPVLADALPDIAFDGFEPRAVAPPFLVDSRSAFLFSGLTGRFSRRVSNRGALIDRVMSSVIAESAFSDFNTSCSDRASCGCSVPRASIGTDGATFGGAFGSAPLIVGNSETAFSDSASKALLGSDGETPVMDSVREPASAATEEDETAVSGDECDGTTSIALVRITSIETDSLNSETAPGRTSCQATKVRIMLA